MADPFDRQGPHLALPGTVAHGQDVVSVAAIARALYRSRWLIAGFFAAGVVAAVILTMVQSPQYESEATIQIHGESASRASGLAELGPAIGFPGIVDDGSGIETDMLVMTSRRIVEHVVDSLSLHVELVDPPMARSDLFSAVRAPKDITPFVLHLQRNGSSYRVRTESTSTLRPHPDVVEVGKPFVVGGLELTLRDGSDTTDVDRIAIAVRPFRDAVQSVQSELEVARAGRGTQIVTVTYRNRDPILAAAVPNAIMDAFIHHTNETNKAENRSRANFLRQQVAQYEMQLADAEARLREFREQQQIISIEDQAAEQVRRYAQLQSRRDELQEERDALRRLLRRVQAESAGSGGEDTYRQLASFPVFFANPTIQNIIRSLIDLENSRAQLMVRRTEENIDVQGIDKRIDELELQLLETAENYLESRENQMASLDATLAEFAQQAGTVPAREVEFARLAGQRELLAGIHRQLQMRLHEVEVEEAVEPMHVQLLDPALIAERPASPRPLLNVVLGSVLGLGLGLVATFITQGLDTRVRSRADVQLAAGGLPIVATIPRVARHTNGRPALGVGLPRLRPAVRAELPPTLVSRDEPFSPAAEAYRSLRTRLYLRHPAGASSLVVVTSAHVGEGKTTTSANLAVSLSQQGWRTLIVDADMRKGRLHEVFGLSQAPGLAELLRGERRIDEVVQTLQHGETALHVIASGQHPVNPAELATRMADSAELAQLRREYDHVVIDTPPLGLAAEAAVICALSSATVLLVARAGFSTREGIERVSEELRSLGVQVGGIIINDIVSSEAPAYGYHNLGYSSHA